MAYHSTHSLSPNVRITRDQDYDGFIRIMRKSKKNKNWRYLPVPEAVIANSLYMYGEIMDRFDAIYKDGNEQCIPTNVEDWKIVLSHYKKVNYVGFGMYSNNERVTGGQINLDYNDYVTLGEALDPLTGILNLHKLPFSSTPANCQPSMVLTGGSYISFPSSSYQHSSSFNMKNQVQRDPRGRVCDTTFTHKAPVDHRLEAGRTPGDEVSSLSVTRHNSTQLPTTSSQKITQTPDFTYHHKLETHDLPIESSLPHPLTQNSAPAPTMDSLDVIHTDASTTPLISDVVSAPSPVNNVTSPSAKTSCEKTQSFICPGHSQITSTQLQLELDLNDHESLNKKRKHEEVDPDSDAELCVEEIPIVDPTLELRGPTTRKRKNEQLQTHAEFGVENENPLVEPKNKRKIVNASRKKQNA